MRLPPPIGVLLLFVCALPAATGAYGQAAPEPGVRLAWVHSRHVFVKGLHGPTRMIVLPHVLKRGTEVSLVRWFPDGRRLAVLRAAGGGGNAMLDVVEVRTRRVRTIELADGGITDMAVSAGGRIALARTPQSSTTGSIQNLALYVVDVSHPRPVSARVVPRGFVAARDASFWLTELAWSPRGELSYVLGGFRGSSTDRRPLRSTLFVTTARPGALPRALTAFLGDVRFGYATAWGPGGRGIAFAFADYARDRALVRTVTRTGRVQQLASVSYAPDILDIDWLKSSVLLLKIDDAYRFVYEIDGRNRKPRQLLRPDRPPANEIAGASGDGRYIAFEVTYPDGFRVFDLRSPRRWFMRSPGGPAVMAFNHD